MKLTEDQTALTVINALAAAQILHECLDELEDTPYYRQALKVTTKRMQTELSKTLDNHINHLWEIDEGTMVLVQEGMEAITKELATMDPARIAKLGDMLKNEDLVFNEPN